MSVEEKIAHLAQLSGIYREYWDIWGGLHPIRAETDRIFLRAMGHRVDDEAALDAAIAAHHERHWRSVLPPVLIRAVGSPLAIEACLPRPDGEVVRWSVAAEDGQTFAGTCEGETMSLVEERTVDGHRLARWRLVFTAPLPAGYHQLRLETSDRSAETVLIVAPPRCYLPSEGDGARAWGVSLQLYSLRSQRNWGLGDFSDLQAAARVLAAHGADFIGINPLHALYPHEPQRASPYSPSSRQFLNPLYLDPEALEDFAAAPDGRALLARADVQDRLTTLRAAERVDYGEVAGLKQEAFAIAHRHFRDHHLSPASERGAAFRAFQSCHAPALRRYALYDAMTGAGETLASLPPPDDPRIDAIAERLAFEIERSEYLQWQCDLQLERAASACRDAGMRIGLYRDLAVGCDSGGADVWAEPDTYAKGVNAGAPPDALAVQGQAWGLSPWRPDALRHSAFRSFVSCVRANMRHAGALRIDHVVGLMRQFWVPNELGAAWGGYVASPFDELLAVLALESERAGCIVIGEDLGTVPDEVRAALHAHDVLSYRVLYFEKHWEGDHTFRGPEEYPELALATTSTHDLPTLAGYCVGSDLAIRKRLGLFPDPETEQAQIDERQRDIERLAHALASHGLNDGGGPDFGHLPDDGQAARIHQFLARTRARLMNAQIEDLLGVVEQANVPGTTDEEPNWHRKLAVPIEDWDTHPRLRAVAERLRAERPRPERPQ